jgi:hypothetical protein
MSFYVDSIVSEGLVSLQSLQAGTTLTTVASGTQSLTVASTTTQIYQGTVSGQIVKMPDATTLSAIGYRYKLNNDSTQNVTVQDSAAGALFLLGAGQRAELVCTSVASAAGSWSYQVSSKNASGKTDFETTYPGTGLSVNYVGGVFRFNGALTQVAGGTIALPASTTGNLYVDVDAVIKATASLPDGAMPLYAFVTTGAAVTSLTDCREDYESNMTYGVAGDISATTKSNAVNAGSLNKVARADHVHASTLPLYKSGTIAAGSFTGTPRTAAVTFGTAFPGTTYTVNVTGTDGRSWVVNSLTAAGFTISSQANAALSGLVYYQAVYIGESV